MNGKKKTLNNLKNKKNYHSGFYQLYDIKIAVISIDNLAKQTKESTKANSNI